MLRKNETVYLKTIRDYNGKSMNNLSVLMKFISCSRLYLSIFGVHFENIMQNCNFFKRQQDCIENLNGQLNDLKLSNIDLNETNCNLMEREREFANFITKVIDENCHFKVNYRFFENKVRFF